MKYTIYTRLVSFVFPLREATRKQIWSIAKSKLSEGYKVEVILLTDKNECFEVDGVKIKSVNRWKYHKFDNSDVIHFITGSICIWLFIPVRLKGVKKLTLTDGDMHGRNMRFMRNLIKKLLPTIYNDIFVYSNYQLNRLGIKNVSIVKPNLEYPTFKTISEKYIKPTLLYMGHLSYIKGVDILIDAYEKVKTTKIPDLELVIANNSIAGDKDLIEKVKNLKLMYKESVHIKGIIDPFEELQKAWIYIYPFKSALGTMAFSMSLYEATLCKTPFIACDVGANKEFFDNKYLIPVNNSNALATKIIELLNA